MGLKGFLLTAIAAAVLPAVVGCHALSETAYTHNCPPDPCYGAYKGDFGGMLNAPCRMPWGYGPGHCGLVGFAKQMGAESHALVACMASDHWYGSYPYGACGPWVGRWDGCCGSGGMADPCACCNGTPYGQPAAER
jgi:hypothetical protein